VTVSLIISEGASTRYLVVSIVIIMSHSDLKTRDLL